MNNFPFITVSFRNSLIIFHISFMQENNNNLIRRQSLSIKIFSPNKSNDGLSQENSHKIELLGVNLVKFEFTQHTMSQSFIAEGGKRRLTSKDMAKATLSVKILGTSLPSLPDLRKLAFSGEKQLYDIHLEDGSNITGKFIITAFKITAEPQDFAEIILEITSAGKITCN